MVVRDAARAYHLNRRQRVTLQNSMPTQYIIALLIAERDKLNRAIEALQGAAKRPGRPPKNPLAASTNPAAGPSCQET